MFQEYEDMKRAAQSAAVVRNANASRAAAAAAAAAAGGGAGEGDVLAKSEMTPPQRTKTETIHSRIGYQPQKKS